MTVLPHPWLCELPRTGEPAPRQMHAQFLHQFAFAGNAVQMTDQENAQPEFGINRGATGLAVAGSQSLPHKLKTDVLLDQPQQMVLGNLIFQGEVLELALQSGRVAPS